jgi:hypothetical protein
MDEQRWTWISGKLMENYAVLYRRFSQKAT